MLCQLQTLTLHLSFEICEHLLVVPVIRLNLIEVCFVAHFANDLVYIRLQLDKLIRKLIIRVCYPINLGFIIVDDRFYLFN